MTGKKVTRKEMVRMDLVEIDVFEDIATGMTVANVQKKYQCSTRIFYEWLGKKPDRQDTYEAAKKMFAQTIAEETLSIADSTIDPGEAAINKVRIDARRWLASKVAPDVYGDKAGPQINITLQSEHLQALKEVTIENSVLANRSGSRDD